MAWSCGWWWTRSAERGAVGSYSLPYSLCVPARYLVVAHMTVVCVCGLLLLGESCPPVVAGGPLGGVAHAPLVLWLAPVGAF